jgi:hypothetical protein
MRPLVIATLLLALSACRTDPEKPDTDTLPPDDTGPDVVDSDGDGYGTDEDCDDGDAAVHPGAEELCDGLDNDCDDEVDEGVIGTFHADGDGDGYGDPDTAISACTPPDGYVEDATDCDDGDADSWPGAPERCDGADNDCDGEVDEELNELWYADADGDGFGNPANTYEGCDPGPGWVLEATDCDDSDSTVFPGAAEECNDTDDDCDGEVDEDLESTWYADADGDGFGDPDSGIFDCEPGAGWVEDSADCDDANSSIHPDASEICDELDNDCDGLIDDADDSVTGTATWYTDADGDGFGDDASTTTACEQPSGTAAYGGDCDDGDTAYNPGASESDCTDPADYNCDGSSAYADVDGDGFAACEECDDGDAAVNPDATERCDGVDNDCDGTIDEDDATDALTWYADADGDGFGDSGTTTAACDQPSGYVGAAYATDCDDTDAAVSPVDPEICDGVDNDCDGSTDEGLLDAYYADSDGDGYGDAGSSTEACAAPSGFVEDDTDCDDSDATVNPGANERCDEQDNDCDGLVDDDDSAVVGTTTWYVDYDGDGYGGARLSTAACEQPSGYVADASDCDDTDASAWPGAEEICDGADNDCDGTVDEGLDSTWYADSDGDGFGDAAATASACAAPSGYTSDDTDCDDGDAAINPDAYEACDGIDNDCDGLVDDDDPDAATAGTWYADADGDGLGDPAASTSACAPPSGTVADATDCDDGDPAINPAASEVCDGIDNDCDGLVDDDDPVVTGGTSTWYVDYDGDGYGGALLSTDACSQPRGYVADATDCDDGDAATNPGASEVCDGADNDCDGDVDEGATSEWFLDYDGDGYGDDATGVEACSAPSSYYVSTDGDCDDTDADVNPGAPAGCDGGDWDCDGLVDNDADLDGYADAACGGDDCDDSDAAVLPEVGGGCALGTTCLDQGRSIGDGDYTIDPDGYATGLDPFDVYCDMSTDGGGWTAVDYADDLTFTQHFTGGDTYQYLPDDFELVLSDAQVAAIQALSTNGWQYYEGWCEHVIHYYYTSGASYAYAFGFMFFDGTETPYASSSYSPHDITVTQDGCKGNGGEGGDPADATIFYIESPLVPVINVQCRDCGDTFPEYFGSPLTDNSAWLR